VSMSINDSGAALMELIVMKDVLVFIVSGQWMIKTYVQISRL
jgi:hypothetical protein